VITSKTEKGEHPVEGGKKKARDPHSRQSGGKQIIPGKVPSFIEGKRKRRGPKRGKKKPVVRERKKGVYPHAAQRGGKRYTTWSTGPSLVRAPKGERRGEKKGGGNDASRKKGGSGERRRHRGKAGNIGSAKRPSSILKKQTLTAGKEKRGRQQDLRARPGSENPSVLTFC